MTKQTDHWMQVNSPGITVIEKAQLLLGMNAIRRRKNESKRMADGLFEI